MNHAYIDVAAGQHTDGALAGNINFFANGGSQCGGIYLASGTFEMLGGKILKNKTTYDYSQGYGGGVYIGGVSGTPPPTSNGNFIMSGGTIFGADGGDDSNTIIFPNRGAALYVNRANPITINGIDYIGNLENTITVP